MIFYIVNYNNIPLCWHNGKALGFSSAELAHKFLDGVKEANSNVYYSLVEEGFFVISLDEPYAECETMMADNKVYKEDALTNVPYLEEA